MRKVSLLVILILAFGAITSASTMHSAQAYTSAWDWLGQVHSYDPYFGSYSITVFPEGSTATLTVTVYNPSATVPLNVSAVKAWLDWNDNFSSTECSEDSPLVIQPHTSHTFTVTFPVPSTSTASNLVTHGYTIYVEEVNATTGPKQVSNHDTDTGTGFVVYSTTQKNAQRLYDEVNALIATSPTFLSIEGEMLWENGTLEYQLGLSSHRSGDFSNAKTHYEDALELLHKALSNETSYQKNLEDLATQLLQAQVEQVQANASYLEALGDAAKIRAQAFNTQAIAWIVFGLGFMIFGVAAVVWAYRGPVRPPS